MTSITIKRDTRRQTARWAGYVDGRRVGRWTRSLDEVVQVLRLRHGAPHLTSARVLSAYRHPEHWGWWVEFDLPRVAVLGLTLRPWWAWAVAHGGLRQISGPWRDDLRGYRLAIHAGWWGRRPQRWVEDLSGQVRRLPRLESMSSSCIVATAALSSVRPRVDRWGDHWSLADVHTSWVLSDVRPLRQPVPVERGQLGLWRLPEGLAWAVEDAAKIEHEDTTQRRSTHGL